MIRLPLKTLLAALALAAWPGLLSAPTPGDQPENLTKLFVGNLGAILGGVAGVLAALGAYLKNRKEMGEFQKDFLNQLLKPETISVIRDRGRFLSDESGDISKIKSRGQFLSENDMVTIKDRGHFLRDDAGDIERIRKLGGFICAEELEALVKRLIKNEEVLYDISITLERLSPAIEDSKVRAKLEEQAQKMRDVLRKV